jgi:hypothetical protein
MSVVRAYCASGAGPLLCSVRPLRTTMIRRIKRYLAVRSYASYAE